MVYLSSFHFPDREAEQGFAMLVTRTCYDTFYPFSVLSGRNLERLEFESITILYGGNGCGKTTALNVIAEKLKLQRDTLYNRSSFFEEYIRLCDCRVRAAVPDGSCIITSDDVFDFMLNLRSINEGIDTKREELFGEYMNAKYSEFKMRSLEDYQQLKQVNTARRDSQSKYVRKNLMGNLREHSNGESAFQYFCEKIGENRLYLLDEPENSLSPERQLELKQYLEDSARFFGCQLILATHSPFLLAMKGAKIYDMDADPVCVKNWTNLKNVRMYYDFFSQHADAFRKTQTAP